ncbi:cytochrome ubiquinol oxidase subunit I [Altererythrobacter soli]|uniref:Cytochrome ubiquinol oxidase subunit I n=1 Tax=Croceibacterium soli TaxID=1739690 RepID=A0A6I4USG4_9SPHN|nr:cbb3-type cytochrome c oxidase subunit I [Croceibacterium soli]MXP41396.1 cytochrome ubiquinol oxidase subunit I [Croceibacterium soli]
MSSETGFDTRLYERFPTSEPRPEGELEELQRIWAAPRGLKLLTAVNNNYVGFWYVATSLLFFLLAGILALGMRVQLAAPMQEFLDQETYNQFFTMHGTVMMFLFAVPAVEAIGIMLLPQMLAARDLPFPRLSAYAFWAYLVGGLAFFCSIFVGLAPDGGWFMYPPLTSKAFSPGLNADFWLLGIGFIEISAIAGAVEIIVGVLKTRAPNMTLDRMPMFAWAMLVFAVMIVVAFPSVILCTLLLEIERAFNWPFFDPTRGGDPLLWQHLFWFFGHPEVYIIFIPAAGLMSMMVATVARTELVGYRLNVLALVATGFISFGVWAHHMFATDMPRVSSGYFSAASMAVSLPAGIQVFCWIATLASGKVLKWSTPALFVVGSIVTFTMGGLTGVMLGMVPFDWQVHDTYFVVAHLHYVLIGGMVFPMFAALYYWTPMTSRKPLSERLGRWVFWLMFTGMHVTFLPMHLTGLMGMPRRVYTYLPGREIDLLNLTSTIGAFTIAAGVLLFLFDLARNFRFTTEHDAGNVYGGGTLEWLPTGLYSVRSIPVVRSRDPLWDDPSISGDVEEGRYFLPNAPTGTRETLITSPIKAEPEYIQLMPGPSPWPLAAAVFTAGFFLALTVQAYAFGVFSGVLAVLSVLRWLWETDRPVKMSEADVGAGIVLPIAITGPRSHGWWALNVLMVVIGMIGVMAIFAYLYLYGIHPEVWSAPPALGQTALIVALNVLVLGLSWGGRKWLEKRAGQYANDGPWALEMLGTAVLAGALYLDISGWLGTGLQPTASGMGATVFMLMALQGQVVAVSLVMAIYLAFREARGLLTTPRNVTMDVVARFIAYSALQGIVFALVPRLFPGS